jgi:hypothetical protein
MRKKNRTWRRIEKAVDSFDSAPQNVGSLRLRVFFAMR